MASTDARPVPIKNTAYRAYFGIYKNDGTLITSAAGLDSEVSKDGAAIADCTNEATEIGATGLYYLDLTSTEMNADSVTVLVKSSTTDAVPVVLSLYPQESGDILVNVQGFTIPVGAIPALGIIENGLLQSATSSSIIVLRAGTTLADDVINNCVVEVIAGTGIGQVRLLVDFVGATDTATVDPAFSVTLDNTSHVIIRAAPPAPTGTTYVPPVNVVLVDGRATGEIMGAAATGTLSTTQATSNLTGYANDQLIGRVIIWLSGDCEGEASDITDYASASGLLTFTALTTAPADGDLFKIV